MDSPLFLMGTELGIRFPVEKKKNEKQMGNLWSDHKAIFTSSSLVHFFSPLNEPPSWVSVHWFYYSWTFLTECQ